MHQEAFWLVKEAHASPNKAHAYSEAPIVKEYTSLRSKRTNLIWKREKP